MGKEKTNKRSAIKKAKTPKAADNDTDRAAGKSKARVVAKVAKRAKAKAGDLAANPVVAEIVAATLVAAAAAIKNPQKARALATSVGEELETASGEAADRGGAFWQLAIDVAKRSIESIEAQKRNPGGKAKGKSSEKPKAKAKKKKSK